MKKSVRLKTKKEDLKLITNTNLKSRLLEKDYRQKLEQIIFKKFQQFYTLDVLKKSHRLDFGDKVSKSELKILKLKIFNKIDNFLEIPNIKSPRIGYYNLLKPTIINLQILGGYIYSGLCFGDGLSFVWEGSLPDWQNLASLCVGGWTFAFSKIMHNISKSPHYSLGTITLEEVPRTRLISTIGHEYAHHLQYCMGIKKNKYSAFMEGHARGIEKHIAQHYAKEENNQAFMYEVLKEDLDELLDVYEWINQTYNKKTKKLPNCHAIGNVIFTILEESAGKEIYKQMIHKDFKLLNEKWK